ncbi:MULTISPECIES: AtpZ/AtpI family protein [Kosmotoga]|uniref:ATP synthase protein I n=1 Tax=Kosmotoga olearia (strain ATCC BAA-1733 / DSM 21960 / TBF 19.5.1) TaxID=521045 RepID=C5CIW1_KOSOT|nr:MULTISPECIES: AtpZ/AtpI family protein [Kosmotoga]ACR78950.1 hypothetical protein Kole_0225 [Kosmotoga olearia TBF 19.5.1]OAA24475.1 hypothetical protein DU53_01035 [Kosmotoga sp. DU53]
MKKKRIDFRQLNAINMVFQFGIVVISNILVGGLLGYLTDKYLFHNKIWLVIFLFLGTISGIYQGIRYLMKEAEKYERLNKDSTKRNDSDKYSGDN